MSSRRRRREGTLVFGLIIVLVAFALGSGLGVSMGFNSSEPNVVQNNTTHVPIDVTHNISAYENKSNNLSTDSAEASNSSNGVVKYSSGSNSSSGSSQSSSSGSSSDYQTNDVQSSQYY